MRFLETLVLADNQVGAVGLECICEAARTYADAVKLKQLWLGSNSAIGDAGVEALARACKGGAVMKLTDLKLDNAQVALSKCPPPH